MLNAQQIQWILQELATRPVLPMNGAQAKQAIMNQMIVEQQLEQDLKAQAPAAVPVPQEEAPKAEAPTPIKRAAKSHGQRKTAQGGK